MWHCPAAAFAAPLASPLTSTYTPFCPSLQRNSPHGPYHSSARSHRRPRARAARAQCCANDVGNGNKLEREALEEELRKLEGTKLKWAEIDFPDIQSELRAIDEYVQEEGIEEGDCWPIFLRACAYESRGQSQLAIAQFSKVLSAAGLSMVPNLWERRAYNTFKVGDLEKADALYDVSIRILTEAVGNELHFAHWFDDNFSDFLPRHNGPSFAVQRAISKYCIGDNYNARAALVPAIIVRDTGAEHAVLWLIACTLKPDTRPYGLDADLRIIEEWRTERYADYNNSNNNTQAPTEDATLRLCLDIFLACAKTPDRDISQDLSQLKHIARNLHGNNSVRDTATALIYLALYHDAIDIDHPTRDSYLDKLSQLPGSPSIADSLDFVYHAARYKFGTTIARKYNNNSNDNKS